jgi:uncharacterized protein YbjT (DUF2867 family)
MKILLTGATGYIGKRLLPQLVDMGHQVVCSVRDRNRFTVPEAIADNVSVIEVDFLDPNSTGNIPLDIDAAYYLMHSMSSSSSYEAMERQVAENFSTAMNFRKVEQVIYLSGIVNEDSLSKHLSSRKAVEEILEQGDFHLTTLRAGIIIGSGSASYEIIRDLVEKLPIMVVPKWLHTRCQPIAVSDVIKFLSLTLFNEKTFDRNFDIGGPDVLSYKEMLLGYAEARRLTRIIKVVPVMTPKLSSYWLYFVTSTSYNLATALVASMKIEVVCRDNELSEILGIEPISYWDSLQRTLQQIETHFIESSWKDSLISSSSDLNLSEFINVPTFGCFVDKRQKPVEDKALAIDRIWRIGGENGWYAANSLWRIRGFLDKLAGGVGLRRGRTNPDLIHAGDTVDFWRVLLAEREKGRLLLFAEMKLPGEAWLEFRVKNDQLIQTATFRPRGLWGRIYWFAVYPLHGIVFKGMLNKIAAG